MARLPTTADVFNAVAEPQRRDILDLLRQGEQSVNEIALALDLRQPQTSKHLKVLKEVELVSVRTEGKQRIYELQGAGLKSIHDWITPFEQAWSERFDRLDAYLQQLQAEEKQDATDE